MVKLHGSPVKQRTSKLNVPRGGVQLGVYVWNSLYMQITHKALVITSNSSRSSKLSLTAVDALFDLLHLRTAIITVRRVAPL
jgi:hypothetical protein